MGRVPAVQAGGPPLPSLGLCHPLIRQEREYGLSTAPAWVWSCALCRYSRSVVGNPMTVTSYFEANASEMIE